MTAKGTPSGAALWNTADLGSWGWAPGRASVGVQVNSAVYVRGSTVTQDVTEPLPAIGNPGPGLSSQIARFGSLAARELSGPLSASEQLEMLALRAAIIGDARTVAPSGTGEAGQSGSSEVLNRPARLWRPAPLPGPRRGPARHRRIADTNARG